jgi:pimeloyl-ACP methyl ester carboxylesterase
MASLRVCARRDRRMDQVLDINGISTRCRRAGSGPPVLVLHGWGARIEAVQPIINGLAPRLTVHAVDLPGFGESGLPPEPWGVTEYADWTRGLMDALGLEQPSVIGHSNGGRIAIHLAAHHPERIDKLILVDAAGIRPKRGITYYRRVYTAKAAKHGARFLGAPGRRLQQRVFARSASSDYANAGPLRPTFVKLVNEDLTPLLPRIQASTLLIWGETDTAAPVSDGKAMERLIPDAGLVVFEGAGHFSYLDQPQRFTRVALHFLAAPVAVAS